MKASTLRLVVILIVVALVASAAGGLWVAEVWQGGEAEIEATTVVFAIGHGFHYTIPIVMEHFGLLGKYSDGGLAIAVEPMTSGIITEGLIAGQLQFAQRSGPAILKNLDSGAGIKILASMGIKGHELWTSNPNIKSLEDLRDGVTVAVNNPTSVQAIGLKIALQRFGRTLDDIEPLYLKHPDAYQLMISGKIDCHYVGAPYSSRYANESEKFHRIATDVDIFQVTMPGSLLYASTEYVEANPVVVASVLAAWYEAISWVDANPEAAARMVAEFYGDPVDTAYQDWQEANMVFDPTFGLEGMEELARLLFDNGVIGKAYKAEEMLFPVGLGGR